MSTTRRREPPLYQVMPPTSQRAAPITRRGGGRCCHRRRSGVSGRTGASDLSAASERRVEAGRKRQDTRPGASAKSVSARHMRLWKAHGCTWWTSVSLGGLENRWHAHLHESVMDEILLLPSDWAYVVKMATGLEHPGRSVNCQAASFGGGSALLRVWRSPKRTLRLQIRGRHRLL